jgi:hypothetical protein
MIENLAENSRGHFSDTPVTGQVNPRIDSEPPPINDRNEEEK